MRTLGNIARRLLPDSLSRRLRVRSLRRAMKGSSPLNVILGAADTSYPGWFATNLNVLDITSASDWARLFTIGSIDRLLAEHVFEHLSEDEGRRTWKECYRYLKPGGLLRIAVPDGYRRDTAYLDKVAPPNDGHKVFYTVDSLSAMLEAIGFQVTPLEYFDAAEVFHAQDWDERDGLIQRSARFDKRPEFKHGDVFYTSLIIDARKS